MNRIFIDMDGVLVDFDALKDSRGLTADVLKAMPGAYRAMAPIPGGLSAVRALMASGFEVWLATKPPTGIAHAYSEKAEWVFAHLPELTERLIITHDKGLLGDAGDYLIDDRPHKANCEQFQGTLIPFGGSATWDSVLAFFAAHPPRVRTPIFPVLRLYTGAALLGTVLSGVFFSASSHRELIQGVSALLAMLLCGLIRSRHRAKNAITPQRAC
jgi:hypothetical protein